MHMNAPPSTGLPIFIPISAGSKANHLLPEVFGAANGRSNKQQLHGKCLTYCTGVCSSAENLEERNEHTRIQHFISPPQYQAGGPCVDD